MPVKGFLFLYRDLGFRRRKEEKMRGIFEECPSNIIKADSLEDEL
jgi:hypothetical protein